MTITFWGVRGSLPTPGPTTVRYGGNTSCVAVELGSLQIIFDAGTGIHALGQALSDWPGDICIVLSHLHWDHVHGLPFFAPLFIAGRPLFLIVPEGRGRTLERIAGMDGEHFPLTSEDVTGHLTFLDDPAALLEKHAARLHQMPVNHPGGSVGYRLEHGGNSFVFIPDNELEPPYPRVADRAALAEFSRGADVLVHDAQYLPEDLPQKRGWGHSEVSEVCELALEAGVGHLVLFHHDPTRTDDAVDAIQQDARAWFRARQSPIRCDAAAEGMAITL